jgi:hypothetical protein
MAALCMCCVLGPAAAARAGTPALPEHPIPVHVVFSGTGQFHYDNSEGSYAGPFPPGTPTPPPETTPAPRTDALVIQGITYLSADPGRFSDCVGARGDFDGSGEAADGVGTVLDQSLPGALAARIPQVSRQAFLAGGVALRTIPVSDADAPTQIPESCADLFGIDDPSKCTETLSWSGTVLLDATAGCPLILAGPSLAACRRPVPRCRPSPAGSRPKPPDRGRSACRPPPSLRAAPTPPRPAGCSSPRQRSRSSAPAESGCAPASPRPGSGCSRTQGA